MAFNQAQIALNASTATPLLVQGSSAGQFVNIEGNATDPLPVLLTNTSSTIVIYLGGSGVASSNGTPIQPLASFPLSLIGGTTVDIPYAIAATGTPSVAVLVGRQ